MARQKLNKTIFLNVARYSTAAAIIGMMTIMSGTADAQTRRVNALSLTCDQARSMISQQGAVIMSTGRNTFDRYVSNRSYCQVNEVAKSDFIPTKDNAKCPVRRCGTVAPFGFNR